ncbi:hypothetical protein F260042K2_27550 [Flavonifractor plautii]
MYDLSGNIQPDLTDLLTCQEKKGEHKGAGKEEFWVLALKTEAGDHGANGLEYKVSH